MPRFAGKDGVRIREVARHRSRTTHPLRGIALGTAYIGSLASPLGLASLSPVLVDPRPYSALDGPVALSSERGSVFDSRKL